MYLYTMYCMWYILYMYVYVYTYIYVYQHRYMYIQCIISLSVCARVLSGCLTSVSSSSR